MAAIIDPQTIEILKCGQECPFCGFALLVRDESNEVVCPVCGYGTGAPRM